MDGIDWGEVDLTLRSFGVKTMEWSGRKWDYVLTVLEDVPDENIEALLAFLGAPKAAEAPMSVAEVRKPPWDGSFFRLFASHRADDKALVSEVKKKLAWFAIDLFVAHEDIEPSKEWLEEIDIALDTCDALAAFLTPTFHGSEWCDQEVGFAMRRRVLIVPVCLGVTPYGFMNRYQGLKADKLSPEETADSIFEILISNDLTAVRMSEALVDQTANARSFDEANAGSKLLRRVTRWTPELLRKLEESLESNSQVRGAFTAPGRIRTIIASHRS